MQKLDNLFKIDEDELTDNDIKAIDECWCSTFSPVYWVYYTPEAEAKRVVKSFVDKITQLNGRKYARKALEYIYEWHVFPTLSDGFTDTITPCISNIIEKTIVLMKMHEASEEQATSNEIVETPAQQEVPAPEDVQALRKRITELEEVNEQQQAEIQELTIKNAELEIKIPKNGRPSNSGLNRYERTALLIELLAGVTGIDAQTLTGADEKIQGKKKTPLSDACCLIADIASSQGHNILSWHREYQRGGRT